MQPDTPARTLLVYRLYAPLLMFYIGFRLVKRRQALLGSNLPRNNQAGWVNNPDRAAAVLSRRGRFLLPIHLPSYPLKNPCRKPL